MTDVYAYAGEGMLTAVIIGGNPRSSTLVVRAILADYALYVAQLLDRAASLILTDSL